MGDGGGAGSGEERERRKAGSKGREIEGDEGGKKRGRESTMGRREAVRWEVKERASDRDGEKERVWREDRDRKGGKEKREGGDG